MRKAHWVLLAVAFFCLLAGSGCYTVLSHPSASDPTMGWDYYGAGYYRSCADCHADAAFYHPYYHYGRSHDLWGDYYGYPWWYDDYWWWDPDDDGGEPGPPVETGTRHIWGSEGGGHKGWSFVLPPSPPPSDEQREGQGTGTQQGGTDKDKKEDGERHLWTPKKKGF